jgi:hypothetical protein
LPSLSGEVNLANQSGKEKLEKAYREYFEELESKTQQEIKNLEAKINAAKEEADKTARTLQPSEGATDK